MRLERPPLRFHHIPDWRIMWLMLARARRRHRRRRHHWLQHRAELGFRHRRISAPNSAGQIQTVHLCCGEPPTARDAIPTYRVCYGYRRPHRAGWSRHDKENRRAQSNRRVHGHGRIGSQMDTSSSSVVVRPASAGGEAHEASHGPPPPQHRGRGACPRTQAGTRPDQRGRARGRRRGLSVWGALGARAGRAGEEAEGGHRHPPASRAGWRGGQ